MCLHFNVFDWLSEYFNNNHPFTNDEVKAITEFSILWNLYENKLCDTNAQIEKFSLIAANYAERPALAEIINHSFQYFRNRYVEANNDFNNLFTTLHFRANDKEEFVRNVLLNNINTIPAKMECLLIIIFRFRCNLFHGLKDVETIYLQNANFEIINSFLAKLLEEHKLNNAT